MIEIKPKFKLHEYVFTVIDDKIYKMLISSYSCRGGGDRGKLYETYELIHSRSEYNNKTIKSGEEIFKTVDELLKYKNEELDKQAIKFK